MEARTQDLTPPLFTSDTNKTTAIVLKLVEPLLKESQTVWMDNFCNSLCLARILNTAQDRLCQYTKTEQKILNKAKDKKLKKGEIILQHCLSQSEVTKRNRHYGFNIPQS
jgi:hypothetical protein